MSLGSSSSGPNNEERSQGIYFRDHSCQTRCPNLLAENRQAPFGAEAANMIHAELPANAGKGRAGKETCLASVPEEGLECRQHLPLQQVWSHSFISQHVLTQGSVARTARASQVCASPSTAWVTDNFRASAPHTRDTTGSLRSQATPGGVRGRGAVTRHPRGSRGRRDTEGAGRQLPSVDRPPRGAQGTEFSRSFRKLSASVTSDKRPGKQAGAA